MKNISKLTTVFLIFASAAFAMSFEIEPDVDVENIQGNYLISLNHPIHGVVESAIKNVIFLKITYPQYDYSEIVEKLNELTFKGATKTIRLKAMIANDYMQNFQNYEDIRNNDYKEGDAIFNLYFENVNNTISYKSF